MSCCSVFDFDHPKKSSCRCWWWNCCHHQDALRLVRPSLGVASFVSVNPPFDWIPLSIPAAATGSLISINRNRGETKGSVVLTSTGLTLGKPGEAVADWEIGYSAVLVRLEEGSDPIIVVTYLIFNGNILPLDPSNDEQHITLTTFPLMGIPQLLQRDFLLLNVPGGTTLSVAAVAVNTGASVAFQEITWTIYATKILNGVQRHRQKDA